MMIQVIKSMIPENNLIDEINRLAEELDKKPTLRDIKKHGKYSVFTYQTRFGSWNRALNKAGFEPRRRGEWNKITNQDLLDELKRLAEKLGEVPTAPEMNDSGKYSVGTYVNRFGSWSAALDKVGFEYRNGGKIPTQELLDELRRFADELGEVPKVQEMSNQGEYSANTYYRRFGSWNAALKAAGLEPTPKERTNPQMANHE